MRFPIFSPSPNIKLYLNVNIKRISKLCFLPAYLSKLLRGCQRFGCCNIAHFGGRLRKISLVYIPIRTLGILR